MASTLLPIALVSSIAMIGVAAASCGGTQPSEHAAHGAASPTHVMPAAPMSSPSPANTVAGSSAMTAHDMTVPSAMASSTAAPMTSGKSAMPMGSKSAGSMPMGSSKAMGSGGKGCCGQGMGSSGALPSGSGSKMPGMMGKPPASPSSSAMPPMGGMGDM